MVEDYREIKEAVEKAGFFSTLQPKGGDGLWIVLAPERKGEQLHGNSFRVVLKAGWRYLVTWSPIFYLVPPGVDLTALCLDCLRGTHIPIPEIPPDIARRYQLVKMSEEEYDRPTKSEGGGQI